MKKHFYSISDYINGLANSEETYLVNISGESSDFIRFNNGNIRQNGHVDQCYLNITLITNQRKAEHTLCISGNMSGSTNILISEGLRVRSGN